MVNLERICEDFARITCDSVEPGGGQSTVNLKRIRAKTLQGLPLTMLILGGRSMVNLERISKDFARITSDSVDPGG